MHLVLRTFAIEHSKGLEARDQGAVHFPQISFSASLSNYLTVPCLSFLIGEGMDNAYCKFQWCCCEGHITNSSVQRCIVRARSLFITLLTLAAWWHIASCLCKCPRTQALMAITSIHSVYMGSAELNIPTGISEGQKIAILSTSSALGWNPTQPLCY